MGLIQSRFFPSRPEEVGTGAASLDAEIQPFLTIEVTPWTTINHEDGIRQLNGTLRLFGFWIHVHQYDLD
jgi:hypothetical protein